MQKNTVHRWILAGASLVPAFALAQMGGMEGPGAGSSLTQIGQGIANAMWIIFTIIAVIAFVMAGILFLTTNGDSEKAKQARVATLWGVVGVIVAILAYSAVTLIGGIVGG